MKHVKIKYFRKVISLVFIFNFSLSNFLYAYALKSSTCMLRLPFLTGKEIDKKSDSVDKTIVQFTPKGSLLDYDRKLLEKLNDAIERIFTLRGKTAEELLKDEKGLRLLISDINSLRDSMQSLLRLEIKPSLSKFAISLICQIGDSLQVLIDRRNQWDKEALNKYFEVLVPKRIAELKQRLLVGDASLRERVANEVERIKRELTKEDARVQKLKTEEQAIDNNFATLKLEGKELAVLRLRDFFRTLLYLGWLKREGYIKKEDPLPIYDFKLDRENIKVIVFSADSVIEEVDTFTVNLDKVSGKTIFIVAEDNGQFKKLCNNQKIKSLLNKQVFIIQAGFSTALELKSLINKEGNKLTRKLKYFDFATSKPKDLANNATLIKAIWQKL